MSPDDGERSVRDWLRHRIDGPKPEPEKPLVEVHVIPAPATNAEDEQDPEPDDAEPEPKPAWWQVRPQNLFGGPTEDEPTQTVATAPGIHVTVHQPTAPTWSAPDRAAERAEERAAERRHRRRVWLAYHGAAAATGWVFGLVDGMANMIASAGIRATPVGIAIGLVTWIVASYLPGLPYMPPALRPVTIWAARIPVCSAALALALHAPGL